jgi:hypothetical protein
MVDRIERSLDEHVEMQRLLGELSKRFAMAGQVVDGGRLIVMLDEDFDLIESVLRPSTVADLSRDERSRDESVPTSTQHDASPLARE